MALPAHAIGKVNQSKFSTYRSTVWDVKSNDAFQVKWPRGLSYNMCKHVDFTFFCLFFSRLYLADQRLPYLPYQSKSCEPAKPHWNWHSQRLCYFKETGSKTAYFGNMDVVKDNQLHLSEIGTLKDCVTSRKLALRLPTLVTWMLSKNTSPWWHQQSQKMV